MEIRDVPVFDYAAQLGYNSELSKLTKPFDSQDAGIIQGILGTFFSNSFLTVSRLVGDGCASASAKVQEAPGSAALTSTVAQNLAFHDGSPTFGNDHQLVSDQSAAALAEFNGQFYWPRRVPANQLPEATALCDCCGHVLG